MNSRLKELAKRRIEKLFLEAERILNKNPERSRRYIQLAWKIATCHTIRLGKMRKKICTRCFTLQLPGKTTTVRLEKNKRLVYTCRNCGKRRVYIYKISS